MLLCIENITVERYNQNMLKCFLDDNNISCYSLSKETKIPYTTINELVRGERSIDDCSVKILNSLSVFFSLTMSKTYDICTKREPIPESLKSCLWDFNFEEEIDLVKYKNQIIPRFLEYGLLEGIKFVDRNYTKAEIQEVARNSKWLTKKTANYLSVFYDVPKDQMKFYSMANFDWRQKCI